MNVFESEKMTVGEFVNAVCSIHDEELAKAFVERYTEYLNAHPPENGARTEDLIKFNVGWCFGEGMAPEDKAMWNKICGALHPVFGLESPSFSEALVKGYEEGMKMRE